MCTTSRPIHYKCCTYTDNTNAKTIYVIAEMNWSLTLVVAKIIICKLMHTRIRAQVHCQIEGGAEYVHHCSCRQGSGLWRCSMCRAGSISSFLWYLTIPELCSILDNRYLCCMISLFELKLPIIFGKKICKDAVQTIQWMNLAPIFRNNGKNEPSRCQLILRYLESSIPLLCGALILQYHFKSSSTPVCAHFLCRSRIREAGGEVDLSTSATRQQCWP